MSFAGLLDAYHQDTTSSSPAKTSSTRPFSLDEARWASIDRGAKTAFAEVVERGTKRAPKRSLAVLILCVDGVPHEAIWRKWALDVEEHASVRVEFFIHVHHRQRIDSEWVSSRLVNDHFDTKWGSVDIVRAELALLAAGLRDNALDAAYFAFASETCLPVAHPAAVAALFDDQASWIDAIFEPNNGYARQDQWEKVSRALPRENVAKADQWLLLTRLHARLMLRADREIKSQVRCKQGKDDGEPWRLFAKVRAADELYFPSMLVVCGELRRDDNSRVRRRKLTYCDWNSGPKSPTTHPALTPALVAKARDAGCLFARKFPASAVRDVDDWLAILSSDDTKSPEDARPHKRAKSTGVDDDLGLGAP